ncbi:MAG: glycosyltransferase family 2 protein [Acidobacteria bacterium]|nr:glycosyltransferase family 2 protein [Acidobacteriota bacterium]
MKNDLVSAVIPAYNHERYVQQSIESVMAQTHRNLELVIFNDGSTDRTDEKVRELLDPCQRRFVRFEYIPKQNEGLATTLNRAIDWARGDYIYTIASDDVAEPDAIRTLYRFLSRHPKYAMAVGDNQLIDATGQRCYWDSERNNTGLDGAVFHTFVEFLQYTRPDFEFTSPEYGSYRTLMKGNYITNGKLFRRRALIEVGKYLPGIKLEDWYMNLQLSKKYKIKFINKVLLSYRWHDTNTIKNPDYHKGSVQRIFELEKEYHARWLREQERKAGRWFGLGRFIYKIRTERS